MKKFTILLLFIWICAPSYASDWNNPLKFPMEVAKKEGKLLLVKFKPDENAPKKVRHNTWDEIKAFEFQYQFVFVQMSFDPEGTIAQEYGIKSAPALLILDAWGNKIYKYSGHQKKESMRRVLASFPTHVGVYYDAYSVFMASNKNALATLGVAEACQHYGASKESGDLTFAAICNEFMGKARRQSRRSNNELILDKIDLLQSLNAILRGQAERGIFKIKDLLARKKVDVLNEGLAYYILILGAHIMGDLDQVEAYVEQLDAYNGGDVYLRKLGRLAETKTKSM